MKSTTRIVISLSLTILFLFLFLRSFDPGKAWDSLRGASPALLLAAVAVNLLAYPVRAWRWRHLLAPLRERIGLYNLVSTTIIGFMLTFVLPFRIGEIVRPVLLARREKVSNSAAIATIALERLFDAMTVMVLFASFWLSSRGREMLAVVPGGESQDAAIILRRGALAALLAVAIGLPLVILLVIFPREVVGFARRINRGGPATRFGRAIVVLEQFLGGLGSVRRVKEMSAIAASSLVMWLMIDLSVWLGLKAFDLPLTFFDTFLLMVALTVGISIPTPGGVGPYEYLCQISLIDFWGVPAATAGAVAVALHATAILPPILVGLLLMWRDGVRPAEVRTLAAQPAASGGGPP